MTVSLSRRDCKSLLEDYHNGPFYSSPDFPSSIIAICVYLSFSPSLSLSGKIDGWNILRNMRIKSQRRKHLRGTPQWMRIWRMLIKQCHDLLSVTKHLLFQSQRLGFLENVAFGHSSVNLFASVWVALRVSGKKKKTLLTASIIWPRL